MKILGRNYKINLILILFIIVIGSISFGDAVISYTAPIYLENKLQSFALAGLVLSFSSVVGIASDLFIGHSFRDKHFIFFLRWTVITAVLFPIILFLAPPYLPLFLFGMAIWGIYYELIQFSKFNFIKRFASYDQHAKYWGLIGVTTAVTYSIGPVAASRIIDEDIKYIPYFIIGFYVIGTVTLLILNTQSNPKKKETVSEKPVSRNILNEFLIWKVFIKEIWHLLLFVFSIYVIDSIFWSVGTLVSEQMSEAGYGGLLFIAYGIPPLFTGLVVDKIAKIRGKKVAAFFAGILAGLIMMLFSIFSEFPLVILAITFTSSLCLQVAIPLIFATFEDFISRLETKGNDLVGLQSGAVSLSYVVGPLIGGTFTSIVGEYHTFAAGGLLLFLISILCLFVVPRKVDMPQKELSTIEG